MENLTVNASQSFVGCGWLGDSDGESGNQLIMNNSLRIK